MEIFSLLRAKNTLSLAPKFLLIIKILVDEAR